MSDLKSPKKQSLMPSSPLRRKLRAEGHALKPIVQIGTNGLTEAAERQIRSALATHELIKVAVSGDAPEDRFEVAARLSHSGISVVQIIGHMILAYQAAPKPKKPALRSKHNRRVKTRAIPSGDHPRRPEGIGRIGTGGRSRARERGPREERERGGPIAERDDSARSGVPPFRGEGRGPERRRGAAAKPRSRKPSR